MRRVILSIPVAVLAAIAILLGMSFTDRQSASAASPYPRDIPVLAWHQVVGGLAVTAEQNQLWNFNKDCEPTAPVCNAPNNPETVSITQLTDELNWLKSAGYQSITAAQYQAWLAGRKPVLPVKPVLLTIDDGTLNSFVNVTQVLDNDGFSMVAFIVTQFATGAQDRRKPYIGWDASWDQLLKLPAAQWSFAFHAGGQGHNVTFPNNPGCTFFYPCQLPGESAAQYQYRVSSEITVGRKLELQKLGARLNVAMWAVPWDDLAQNARQPASGADPGTWLAPWAATQFPIVFLQDPHRNGVLHERYRLEVQGTWSLAAFQHNITGNTGNGFFNLGA